MNLLTHPGIGKRVTYSPGKRKTKELTIICRGSTIVTFTSVILTVPRYITWSFVAIT